MVVDISLVTAVIVAYGDQIIQSLLLLIGLASVLIRFYPELDKNHWFKPILQFVGKYIALNRPRSTLNDAIVAELDRPSDELSEPPKPV